MSNTVQEMFSGIAENYDITNDALSFGIHRIWRNRAAKIVSSYFSGNTGQINILDVCTGTGDLALSFAKALGPKAEIIGVDFSLPMLQGARKKLAKVSSHLNQTKEQAPNVKFLEADALNLPFSPSEFDLISISFGIRNVDDPLAALVEFKRLLKDEGKLLVIEFGQPKAPILAPAYRWYSKWLMPCIGDWITGNKDAYTYLPETSRNFPAGNNFEELLVKAGFKPKFTHTYLSGIAYLYFAEKPA